jgi:hypothetical protein
MLLRIAAESLHKAESKEQGWFDHQFVAIALSSLAIEAVCNAVGERAIEGWEDFDSCNPTAKIVVICEQLRILYDKNKEPWSTLVWLSKVRNRIAHPKAEPIDEERLVTEYEHDKNLHRAAPSS